MTGFDTAGELRRRLADRAAVWEFLRLFTAAWDVPSGPAVEVEERLQPRAWVRAGCWTSAAWLS
ncbi:hypothetical protein [Catellatospora tritici]|uniref:hypothetical protein n=1 Tax=Catellatospora tritici TaxID=2851566 RepID=UPI001C2DDD7F|nr:hypothetical protein [Catellatospora tritici]MBV1856543.1 hypothetical protein [Catellatospora tritici]